MRKYFSIATLALLLLGTWIASAHSQRAMPLELAPPERAAGVDQPDPLDELFRKLALDLLPRTYEDDDEWGKTKKFTTGLHVHREGLKIETRRKHRKLNHGRWERYRIELKDEESFLIDVKDVRATDDGRTAFAVEVTVPLKAHYRRSNWRRGVQLWSISADANVHVRVRLDCAAAMQIDTTTFPPAVRLTPEVLDAEIRMTYFQLKGISKIRGEVADEIGDVLRELLEDKVASKDDKLVRKLNKRIDEKQDRLRISLAALSNSPFQSLASRSQPDSEPPAIHSPTAR